MSWTSRVVPAATILALAGVTFAQDAPKPAAPQQPPPAQQQPAVMLKPGDPAPAFSMMGSDGKTHTLAEHAGKQAVVLAWFPKAFTGG